MVSRLEEITASLATVSEENIVFTSFNLYNFLEQDHKPFSITKEALGSCYASLEKAVVRNSSLTGHYQLLFDNLTRTPFHSVEFQAQWHVLGRYFSAEAISAMRLLERSELYLFHLYTSSDKFHAFFPQREAAVRKLAQVGSIALENYSRAEIIIH